MFFGSVGRRAVAIIDDEPLIPVRGTRVSRHSFEYRNWRQRLLQLRPNGGRWIVWADADELQRLRRLRACPINYNAKEQPYPDELTRPKPRLML